MTKLAVSRHAALAQVEGGAVVLNLDTKRYYSLNPSGLVIWTGLERGDEPAVIATEVTRCYRVSLEVAARAVARLIEELRAEALVEDAP